MDFPQLPRDIVSINDQLREQFGIDTLNGQPIWRISWAPDQLEKRMLQVTPEGLQLLHPEVREVKKYPWVGPRWILEQLVLVPEINQVDLPDTKQSYECLWVFETQDGKDALAPVYRAAKFVVDTVTAAKEAARKASQMGLAKYKDAEVGSTPEESREIKKKKIDGIVEELFGDESNLLGRTVTGESIIVPPNFTKSGAN